MTGARPVALVTGASSGIGGVFARRLAQRGFDLILVARRKERLDKLASELGRAEAIAADLTTDTDLRGVEERIASESGLEMLINNAGFGSLGLFHEVEIDGQDRMHRLHVLATMRLTRAALPGMVQRGRGSIINVSSVAAFFHNISSVSYCATKAWMNTFSEGLHLEMKSIGSPVRIQALCPGFTYSEFHDALGIDRGLVPQRLWMSAEEVVDASLRALNRDRCIVIPGLQYRWGIRNLSRLPGRLQQALALRYGSRHRKSWRRTDGANPMGPEPGGKS